MSNYKILLEEEGVRRELELSSDKSEGKNTEKLNAEYTITEDGNDLGKLIFKNGKPHYKGDEEFSPDEINLLAASITANGKETVIDSVEDDIDDEEDDD